MPSSRLTILLASAFAVALAAAPALADPPPPPAPAPVQTPYPNTDPLPPCTHTICLPQPGAVAAKKHIGQVKYEDVSRADATTDTASLRLNVEGISWGKLSDATTVHSADPMEGGQVTARHYTPGKPTFGNVTFEGANPGKSAQVTGGDAKAQLNGTTVYSADPMEGGQVTARTVTGEPAKVEVPNLQISEPVAKGTAKFKTLAGACTTGVHIKEAIITARSGRSYTLHDAIVTSVTPAGDGMEEVSLTYDGVGD